MNNSQTSTPPTWAWSRLDEACRPRLFRKIEGSAPYLEIGNIDILTKAYILSGKPAVKGAILAKKGDVLISRVRPSRGAITIVRDTQIHVSSAISVLTPELGILGPYVHYCLAWNRDFFRYLGVRCTGTMYPTVSPDVIHAYPIPVAPTGEQYRIVAEIERQFARLDVGVRALDRVRVNLSRCRTSVLKAACTGRLVEREADLARSQERGYEPADQLLTRILRDRFAKRGAGHLRKMQRQATGRSQVGQQATFRQPTGPDTSAVPEVPKGWTWASLDQCFLVERGRFSIRPRNDPRCYGGPYPFVQIGDLPRDGGRICRYLQTLNEHGLAISKMFPKGTVLIAIVGATIGNTGILTFDSCCPDSLVAIQAGDEVRLRFAELYLRSKKLEIRRSSYASGGQPNINLATLVPYPIPLPPLAEQQRIVAEVDRRLSVLDQLEAVVHSNLKRAEALRQAILKRAFSGNLVAQDSNDEPASELLERIRSERRSANHAASDGKPKGRGRPRRPAASVDLE